MLKKLWNDEAGFVVSAELVLVATILVIGLVTGLSSVRDAVIEELADVGQAIGNVDQSYSVGGSVSHSASTVSFGYTDTVDFCDTTAAGGTNSRCLVITAAVRAAGTDNGQTP